MYRQVVLISVTLLFGDKMAHSAQRICNQSAIQQLELRLECLEDNIEDLQKQITVLQPPNPSPPPVNTGNHFGKFEADVFKVGNAPQKDLGYDPEFLVLFGRKGNGQLQLISWDFKQNDRHTIVPADWQNPSDEYFYIAVKP